jgi:hypothetical protein
MNKELTTQRKRKILKDNGFKRVVSFQWEWYQIPGTPMKLSTTFGVRDFNSINNELEFMDKVNSILNEIK